MSQASGSENKSLSQRFQEGSQWWERENKREGQQAAGRKAFQATRRAWAPAEPGGGLSKVCQDQEFMGYVTDSVKEVPGRPEEESLRRCHPRLPTVCEAQLCKSHNRLLLPARFRIQILELVMNADQERTATEGTTQGGQEAGSGYSSLQFPQQGPREAGWIGLGLAGWNNSNMLRDTGAVPSRLVSDPGWLGHCAGQRSWR